MKNHERFQWAIRAMRLTPNDRILEIGCGVGFFVQAVVPLLERGKITAIDKSPTAINRAIQRNKAAVQGGKADFVQTDLLRHPGNLLKYTKILCFNINFFWTKSSITRECEVIRSLMAKEGTLYIFYGPVIGKGWEKTAGTALANLEKENFSVKCCVFEEQLKCFYLEAR